MSVNNQEQAPLPIRGFVTGQRPGSNPPTNKRGRAGRGGKAYNNRSRNHSGDDFITVMPIDWATANRAYPEFHFPVTSRPAGSFHPWQEVSFHLDPERRMRVHSALGKTLLSVKPDNLVELHNDDNNNFLNHEPWIPGIITETNTKPKSAGDIGGRIQCDWLPDTWAPRAFYINKLTESDDPASFRVGDHVLFSTIVRLEEDIVKDKVFTRYTDIYRVKINDRWLETTTSNNTNPRLQVHMMLNRRFKVIAEIGGNSLTSSPDIPIVDARTCRSTFVGDKPKHDQVLKALHAKVTLDKSKGDYESNPRTKLFLDVAKIALAPKPSGKKPRLNLLLNPLSFPVPFVQSNLTNLWINTLSRFYDNPKEYEHVGSTYMLVRLPALEHIPHELLMLFYPFRKRFSQYHHNNVSHAVTWESRIHMGEYNEDQKIPSWDFDSGKGCSIWGALVFKGGIHNDAFPVTTIGIDDFSDQENTDTKTFVPEPLGEDQVILSFPSKMLDLAMTASETIFKGKAFPRDGFAPRWEMLVSSGEEDGGLSVKEIISICESIEEFPFSPFPTILFSLPHRHSLFSIWLDIGMVTNPSIIEIRSALKWLGGGFIIPVYDNAMVIGPYDPKALNGSSFVNLIQSGKTGLTLHIHAVVSWDLNIGKYKFLWLYPKPEPDWVRGDGGLDIQPVIVTGLDPFWTSGKWKATLLALGCPENRINDSKWAYPHDKKDKRKLVMTSIKNASNKVKEGSIRVGGVKHLIFLHSVYNRKVKIGSSLFNTQVTAPEALAPPSFAKMALTKEQSDHLKAMEKSFSSFASSSFSSSSSSSSSSLFPSYLSSNVTAMGRMAMSDVSEEKKEGVLNEGGGVLGKRSLTTPTASPIKGSEEKKPKPGNARKSSEVAGRGKGDNSKPSAARPLNYGSK